MAQYKLREPVKNPQSSGYWIFVTLIVSFMLYIMLIRPLTLPADKMPFIFVYDKETKQVTEPAKQKWTYGLLTGGAFVTAGLLMIPTIRRGNRYDYANAKIYANWEYLEDGESTKLYGMLKPNLIRDNGANAVLEELQRMVDSHKGKHIAGRKYFKKSAWRDLEKI